MNPFRKFFGVFVAMILMAHFPVRGADRPNIVLIISDDQAWSDYGFMGSETIQTPHLDRLANTSMLFPRGYVPTALCRPSLMTMATGRYASQHAVTGNDPSPKYADRGSDLYIQRRAELIAKIDRFETIADRLADAGYLTHQSGKWWEGSYQRGGFTHGMTRGFPEPGGRHGDDGLAIGREGIEPIQSAMDQAIAKDQPFFLWYAPFLPHTPHNPPERLLRKYQDEDTPTTVAKYYAMCEWFDETCGQLVQAIEERGVDGNTVIAYVTDNGWIQNPERNGYAPRSKQTPYEGGVRTPIFFHWPDRIDAGVRAELVSSIDLYPTLLNIAGIETDTENLPGLDLTNALFQNDMIERDQIFGESFAHDIADIEDPEASLLYRWTIEGPWKLILTYDGEVNRYQSTHPRDEKRPQLFHLESDPWERANVAASNPEIVKRLAADIRNWWPVNHRTVIEQFD